MSAFPQSENPFASASSPRVEWINCLSGVRGAIEFFPAEMAASDGSPGVVFRYGRDRAGIEIASDFRSREIFLGEKLMLGATQLEDDVPVLLRMGRRLLALCCVRSRESEWAKLYRFPLWTLFEAETFEAAETVRVPADVPAAMKRNALAPEKCLVSPFGLNVAVPFPTVADLFCGNASD